MISLGETIASHIKPVEAEIKGRLDALKKVHDLLKRASSRIAKRPWPFSDTRTLLNDLDPHVSCHTDDVIPKLQSLLKQRLDDAAKTFEKSFIDSLVSASQTSNLAMGTTNGVLMLGPFRLSLDLSKETVNLYYANQPVASPTTMDAEILVRKTIELTEALLVAPTDISKLASEFEESIRVALIRGRKPTQARELRCPLPELHREMTLLRQDRSRAVTSKSFREYPLARFVVELKALIQSEQNVNSSQRFRLEPAVIENTKNPKKSVFVPKDIHKGFGEGTYFQAIVLVNDTP